MNIMIVSENRRILKEVTVFLASDLDNEIELVSFSPNAPDVFAEFNPNCIFLDEETIVPHRTLLNIFLEFNPTCKIIVLCDKAVLAKSYKNDIIVLYKYNISKQSLSDIIENIALPKSTSDNSNAIKINFSNGIYLNIYQDYYHVIFVKNIFTNNDYNIEDQLLNLEKKLKSFSGVSCYFSETNDILIVIRKSIFNKKISLIINMVENTNKLLEKNQFINDYNYVIFILENIPWNRVKPKTNEMFDLLIYSYFFKKEVIYVDYLRKDIIKPSLKEIILINNKILNEIFELRGNEALKHVNELFFRVIKPSMAFDLIKYINEKLHTLCAVFSNQLQQNTDDLLVLSDNIYCEYEKSKKYVNLFINILKTNKISNITLKTIQYIFENINESIFIDTVSLELCVSKGHLSHMFKKDIGFTFLEVVQLIRISNAKLLLEITDLKIKEIANKSGYLDPQYFSRIFKKITNISPEEYRKTKRI